MPTPSNEKFSVIIKDFARWTRKGFKNDTWPGKLVFAFMCFIVLRNILEDNATMAAFGGFTLGVLLTIHTWMGWCDEEDGL